MKILHHLGVQTLTSVTLRIPTKMTRSLLIIIIMIMDGQTGTDRDGILDLVGTIGVVIFGMSHTAGAAGMILFGIRFGDLTGVGMPDGVGMLDGAGILGAGILGAGMAGVGEEDSETHGVHRAGVVFTIDQSML